MVRGIGGTALFPGGRNKRSLASSSRACRCFSQLDTEEMTTMTRKTRRLSSEAPKNGVNDGVSTIMPVVQGPFGLVSPTAGAPPVAMLSRMPVSAWMFFIR